MLAGVLADLAGVVVEVPGLGDLGGDKLDDDVHRTHTVEVVGEMSPYAERRLAVIHRITLYLYGMVHIQGVAEDYLLGPGVYA